MALCVLRTAGMVACAWLLAACSGSSGQTTGDDSSSAGTPPQGTAAPAPGSPDKGSIRIEGSVGSPSLADASLSITDANGVLLTTTVSDALAQFRAEMPAGAELPLQVVASGGLDLLYDGPPPLVQVASIERAGTQTVNVSPLSTLLTAMIECSDGRLGTADAWALLVPQFAMGLPAGSNPVTAPANEFNAPGLILANALLQETLRRARESLVEAGNPVSGNDILATLACDLSDDGALNGNPAASRLLAAARASEAAVLLEAIAHELMIAGQAAAPRLDAALATVLGRSDLTVSRVVESPLLIEQARRAVLLFAEHLDGAEVLSAAAAVRSTPEQAVSELQALDFEAVRSALTELGRRMANADSATLAALETRMRSQAAKPAPTSSFAASPTIVASGEAVQLTWATSGADSCVADQGWHGERATEGAFNTEPLTSTQRYRLTCLGLGGVTSRTIEVRVSDAPTEPPVSLTFSASDDVVDAGERTGLSWDASNASSCVAAGAWSGPRPTSGTEQTARLTEPASYRLDCTGPGGSATASLTVGVGPPPAPAPTLTLIASEAAVASGDFVELSWTSSEAAGCQASGGWSGAKDAAGSERLGPLTASNRYELTCTGSGGSVSESLTVSVDAPGAPTVELAVDNRVIELGNSVRLSWSATDATSCRAEGGWSGSRSDSGSEAIGPLSEPETYRLVCSGPGGETSSSVTVNLRPELAFETTADQVLAGEAVTLSWTSDFADSCQASGGWTGSRPSAGTEVLAITADVGFSLRCTGPGGSRLRTVNVAVENPPEPLVSLSVADPSVRPGDRTTLFWSSSDTTACEASGDWTGSRALAGSASTGDLDGPSTFTLVCTGPGGSAGSSIAVEMIPMVDVSVSADQVLVGDYVTISWSAANADRCTASGDWSGNLASSGSEQIGPLQADASFLLSCSGPGGSDTDVARVSVSAPSAPAVSLLSADDRVLQGESTTLSWDADNAAACEAGGGWSGTRATTGSQSTGALDATTTFTLTCTGPGGTDFASLTVVVDDVLEPTVTLGADDELVDSGDGTRLRWSADNADSCEAGGAWSGSRAASGSEQTGPLTASSTFSLTCRNGAGTAVSMVTVDVTARLTLSWTAPTQNVDGSMLDDLARYRVYYGEASRDYTDQVDVNDPDATSVSITVPAGTYYVAMTAIDADGNESALSNEVEKVAR